jgi:hypothetical protein
MLWGGDEKLGRKKIGLAAQSKKIGHPNPTNLAVARRRAQAANRAAADAFAANVLLFVRQIQAEGVTSLAAIAAVLNHRGIRTARGGAWHHSTVRNLLARAATLAPVAPKAKPDLLAGYRWPTPKRRYKQRRQSVPLNRC